MSKLPLDVLINILSLVSAARDRDDIGGRTLSSCLRVDTLFREAASVPALWKPHYQTRYTHSNEAKEQERRKVLGNDWRLMYRQRREIDSAALKLLEKMVASRIGHGEVATALVAQFMDIWDVLELELTCPIPKIFRDIESGEEVEPENITAGKVPAHAICRRYWAKQVFESIARGCGASIWRNYTKDGALISFDLMMSSLSTVFGVSDKEIASILDDLATLCRIDLNEKSITLNAKRDHYDLRAICRAICVFMRKEGYTSIYQAAEVQTYRSIMHMFPHTYLTTHKATIPICLVHIFVAVATRLGINASPINFPGTVLSHVPADIPGGPTLIINPSALDTDDCIIDESTPTNANLIARLQLTYPNLPIDLSPCHSSMMFIRATHNLHVQHGNMHSMDPHNLERSDIHASTLLPLCVHLIFQADVHSLRSFFSRTKLRLFDCIFLLQELAPYLAPSPRRALEEQCHNVLEKEKKLGYTVRTRMDKKPKYYVGMPVIHINQGYIGFIRSWDISYSVDYANKPFYETEEHFNKDQPYYEIITSQGRRHYDAEESIAVSKFDQSEAQTLYRNWEDFPVWFEGVHHPRGAENPAGGFRLLMSPHLKNEFPDDDRAGAEMVLKA